MSYRLPCDLCGEPNNTSRWSINLPPEHRESGWACPDCREALWIVYLHALQELYEIVDEETVDIVLRRFCYRPIEEVDIVALAEEEDNGSGA